MGGMRIHNEVIKDWNWKTITSQHEVNTWEGESGGVWGEIPHVFSEEEEIVCEISTLLIHFFWNGRNVYQKVRVWSSSMNVTLYISVWSSSCGCKLDDYDEENTVNRDFDVLWSVLCLWSCKDWQPLQDQMSECVVHYWCISLLISSFRPLSLPPYTSQDPLVEEHTGKGQRGQKRR